MILVLGLQIYGDKIDMVWHFGYALLNNSMNHWSLTAVNGNCTRRGSSLGFRSRLKLIYHLYVDPNVAMVMTW